MNYNYFVLYIWYNIQDLCVLNFPQLLKVVCLEAKIATFWFPILEDLFLLIPNFPLQRFPSSPVAFKHSFDPILKIIGFFFSLLYFVFFQISLTLLLFFLEKIQTWLPYYYYYYFEVGEPHNY